MFLVDTSGDKECVPIGPLKLPIRSRNHGVFSDRLVVSGKTGGTLSVPMPSLLGEASLIGRQNGWVDLPAGSVGPEEEIILYGRLSSMKFGLGGGKRVTVDH
jgi:hypothetical protein